MPSARTGPRAAEIRKENMEGKGEQAGEGGKSSIEGGREGKRKGKNIVCTYGAGKSSHLRLGTEHGSREGLPANPCTPR